ncbi:MAG: ABC transporter permease [Acidimicrobiia bacterium]|nr:ABC transporter permease [Acidimicrobiia bacterium]
MSDRHDPGRPIHTKGADDLAETEGATEAWTELAGGKTPPAAVERPATDLEARLEAELLREGLEVEHLTQWQLIRRKFLQHKLAVVSLIVLVIIILAGVFAGTIAPYGFEEIDLQNRSQAPTLDGFHIMGTDKIGRDYFSRVLFGTRTSLIVASIVAGVSTLIGTVVGGLAGYMGGRTDNWLMRLTDLFLTLPGLAILLILSAFLGQGSPIRVAFILAFLFWTATARIVRGVFLSLREKEFVEAAKAAGASDGRIIFRHILPNAMGPIIVSMTLTVATAILVEAALSFLGFGIQPPNPALGKLIADGQDSMTTQWWLVTMPGLLIVTISLCINFIGDGLRDALDPTQVIS